MDIQINDPAIDPTIFRQIVQYDQELTHYVLARQDLGRKLQTASPEVISRTEKEIDRIEKIVSVLIQKPEGIILQP